MPKEEYIEIAGVRIPTDPNQRNAFQRGIVKGWNAAIIELGEWIGESTAEKLSVTDWLINEGGEQ